MFKTSINLRCKKVRYSAAVYRKRIEGKSTAADHLLDMVYGCGIYFTPKI